MTLLWHRIRQKSSDPVPLLTLAQDRLTSVSIQLINQFLLSLQLPQCHQAPLGSRFHC